MKIGTLANFMHGQIAGGIERLDVFVWPEPA